MKIIVKTVFIFLFSGVLMAGQLSESLQNEISTLSKSDKVPVLISMKQAILSTNLNNQLASYKSRADRHQQGIRTLKSVANSSQTDILTQLKQMEVDGLAENVKSHWIINVISADIAVSELETIANLSDVDLISQAPQIKLVEPEESSSKLSSDATSITNNLIMIGADSAKALGYTGEGSVVCSFDTGIEGNHPALYNTWKGHDGDSVAAWFAPLDMVDTIDQAQFPHVYYAYQVGQQNVYHGTHVMGIIVGYDDGLDKQVGVAPGARWISAGVINLLGVSIIDAFEWAADPDGNPNTFNDVPDVINHSWGIDGIGCHDYFWEMIDNTEALGIVNIFAGGNFGPSDASMANPANRAFDSLDCFAVGNLKNIDTIYTSSSRGPSDCDGISIKPNVVAPGFNIESAFSANDYALKSGTSMAAPHVSGAVAILREVAPNATVREIKEALLAGCYGLTDTSGFIPNYTFGYGLINIPASIEYLKGLVSQGDPDVRLYSFDYAFADPGENISACVILKNFGGIVNSLYAKLTNGNAGLEISTDSLYFGTVNTGDTVCSTINFNAHISESVSYGDILTVTFELTGQGNYSGIFKLFIKVGENPQPGFYTHTNDTLRFTVSNFGQYGFNYSSFYPLGYDGFRFGDTNVNYLYEASLMIGTDSEHVSDGAKTILEEPDNDFAIAPLGDLIVKIPGNTADQETFSIFNDSRAENPIGLEITQKTYSWNDFPDNGFVIMEYDIKNTTDTTINDIFTGLYFDWDIGNWEDSGDVNIEHDYGYIFKSPDSILIMYDPPPTEPPFFYWKQIPGIYRGIGVVNEEGIYSHTLLTSFPNAKDLDMTEFEKFAALTKGTYDISYWNYDLFQVVSTGPFTLAPGQSDTAVFVVTGAEYTDDFLANVIQAKNKYYSTTDVEIVDDLILPKDFYLAQNYPNPFNPSTNISFAINKKANVVLSVYNLLGEKVSELANGELPAGTYHITWNGTDSRGKQVASGIYFYRLSTSHESLTKK
ncbi:MAG: S8 family serine peptidase, partial [Candidatus Zixiibacteriota bacterium]